MLRPYEEERGLRTFLCETLTWKYSKLQVKFIYRSHISRFVEKIFRLKSYCSNNFMWETERSKICDYGLENSILWAQNIFHNLVPIRWSISTFLEEPEFYSVKNAMVSKICLNLVKYNYKGYKHAFFPKQNFLAIFFPIT